MKSQYNDSIKDEVTAWYNSYIAPLPPDKQSAFGAKVNAGLDMIDAYGAAFGIQGVDSKSQQERDEDAKLKATDFLLWSAIHGDAQSQYALSFEYESGPPLRPKNNWESFKWCKKSAEGGNPQAKYVLGLKYAQGNGLPPDPVNAGIWMHDAFDDYSKLSDQGDPKAMDMLGAIYQKCGNLVRHDLALAHMWYSLAGRYSGNSLGDIPSLEKVMTASQIAASGSGQQEWIAKHPNLRPKNQSDKKSDK